MSDVRLRIPELLTDHPRVRSAYQIAKLSGFAITVTNAYRLVNEGGATDRVDMATLDGLCAAFGVKPSALLTQDDIPHGWTPPRVKRKTRSDAAAKKRR